MTARWSRRLSHRPGVLRIEGKPGRAQRPARAGRDATPASAATQSNGAWSGSTPPPSGRWVSPARAWWSAARTPGSTGPPGADRPVPRLERRRGVPRLQLARRDPRRGSNPCGADSPEPCDDHGHGTHTIGTVVGTTAAPTRSGSRRAPLDRLPQHGQGVGTPATYLECFEFLLAPWPVGGDPGRRGTRPWRRRDRQLLDLPAVRGLRLGTSASRGRGPPGGRHRDRRLRRQRRSGVRDGVRPAGDLRRGLLGGADQSSDRLAGFSSRGPAAYTGVMKPEVTAPGVSVRSSDL